MLLLITSQQLKVLRQRNAWLAVGRSRSFKLITKTLHQTRPHTRRWSMSWPRLRTRSSGMDVSSNGAVKTRLVSTSLRTSTRTVSRTFCWSRLWRARPSGSRTMTSLRLIKRLTGRTVLMRRKLLGLPTKRRPIRRMCFVRLVSAIARWDVTCRIACMKSVPLNLLRSSTRGVLELKRRITLRCSAPGRTLSEDTECEGLKQQLYAFIYHISTKTKCKLNKSTGLSLANSKSRFVKRLENDF